MDEARNGRTRRHVIAVEGTGRVRAEPDEAIVELGVLVLRPTAAEARDEAAAQMSRVLDALRAASIGDDDLRTSALSLSPTYEHRPDGTPHRTGYEVANRVTATVRAVDRVASVVDGAIAAGATSLDGVSFRRSDEAASERQALRDALGAAHAKASAIADAAGVRLGAIESVEEAGGLTPHHAPKLMRMEAFAVADTPVMGGAIEIVRTVRVEFGIEPARA